MPKVPIDSGGTSSLSKEQPSSMALLLAQADPEMRKPRQATEEKPRIPTLGEVGMSDEEFNETWKKSIARRGRTDEQILKDLPKDWEAFSFGGDSDLIMMRPKQKEKPKLEDLVS